MCAFFGGTGMGVGVLRSALDPDVEAVVSVVRSPPASSIRSCASSCIATFRLLAVADQLTVDACFFCLGATSAGKTEADYTRVTYDITMVLRGARASQSSKHVRVRLGAGTDQVRSRDVGPGGKRRTRSCGCCLAAPCSAPASFSPCTGFTAHGVVSIPI